MKAGAPATRLSEKERLAWLRLIRSENIGPITFRALLRRYGNAETALAAVPDLARQGGRVLRLYGVAEAERELAAAEAIGVRLVAVTEGEYPIALRAIDDAPPLIAIRGESAVLGKPIVSVVGARNASVAGRKFAMQIAAGLGEHEFVVASGLARGIDSAAHEGALATGTVAVFAGGLDRVYPPENEALAARIIEAGGAHISEMPLGWEPRGRDFPRRNRVVSGLALGVVVIEAATRSGSLITARLAGEQGRLVFAAPGSPLDPRTEGSNRLIKDGAHVVTEVADVVAEVSPMLKPASRQAMAAAQEEDAGPANLGESERDRVVEALGPTPVTVDEIVRFTNATPAVVHLVLLELALAGRIERHSGQRVSLLRA